MYVLFRIVLRVLVVVFQWGWILCDQDLTVYRMDKENFPSSFPHWWMHGHINYAIIKTNKQTDKQKLKMRSLRRHELLLHSLALRAVGFLTLRVLATRCAAKLETASFHADHHIYILVRGLGFITLIWALPGFPTALPPQISQGPLGQGEGLGTEQPNCVVPRRRSPCMDAAHGPRGSASWWGFWCRCLDCHGWLQPRHVGRLWCNTWQEQKGHVGCKGSKMSQISTSSQQFHKCFKPF